MTVSRVLFAALLLFAALAAASDDEIKSLPDYPPLKSKNYAGYIDLGNGRKSFYWFVESERDPAKDPLVLWLNGGPGCSSLLGILTEIGPYVICPEGKFCNNSYSWTTLANVLFLESPPGVGFSIDTTTPKTVWNDTFTAELNFIFLQKWVAKYKSFSGRTLYITGESYGGHYVPQLAWRIMHGNDENLKKMMHGFMVGNPCTGTAEGDDLDWCFAEDPNYPLYLKTHALVSIDDRVNNPFTWTALYNPYDIIVPACSGGTGIFGEAPMLDKIIQWDHQALRGYRSWKPEQQNLGTPGAKQPPFEPCDIIFETEYLNRPEVVAAIHADKNIKWESCGGVTYPVSNKTMGVLPQYRDMMNNTNWTMLVYSGDADTVVNFIQTEKVIASLARPVVSNYTPWYYADPKNSSWKQLGGWYVQYDRVTWASVRAAGHMVPTFQPAAAYQLFRSFLEHGVPSAEPYIVAAAPPEPQQNNGKAVVFIEGIALGIVVSLLSTLLIGYCRGLRGTGDEEKPLTENPL